MKGLVVGFGHEGRPGSVRMKPPFWFRPNTKTETQYLAITFGRYRNQPKLYNLEFESIIPLHALSITKTFIWYTTYKYHVNQLQIYYI